ncbi:hypothetical protein QUB63_17100 [Microcoleus sp. ARI1-B5]|uniref:hypothetical protein n=1 Tax=unclassified Microcoleus TaxID=2642155 RepID=UPI002FCFB422
MDAKKPGLYKNIGFGNETSPLKPGLVGIVRSGPYFQLATADGGCPHYQLLEAWADIATALTVKTFLMAQTSAVDGFFPRTSVFYLLHPLLASAAELPFSRSRLRG